MKVFWSWQSDTDGRTGRHFVRRCLADAVKELKQPDDLEQPTTRETREEMHLDHDRQGVSGSPDLAPTILKKIDAAAVFICDVTLVAQNEVREADGSMRTKQQINSNVAIEYGYALHRLTDERILMVQNTHFGNRETLPFDLRHKAGPIQYNLAPDAPKDEVKRAAAGMTGQFVAMLRPFLKMGDIGDERQQFAETPTSSSQAAFWKPGETLARYGEENTDWGFSGRQSDRVEYSFDARSAFYLRLIPTKPLPNELRVTDLLDLVNGRKVLVLTRAASAALPDRNRHGAICFEPHGNSTTPTAFTQLFRNGEIWGVTGEFVTELERGSIIKMPNVTNVSQAALQNWFEVAAHHGIEFPVEIEVGATGISGMYLPTNTQGGVAGPLHQDEFRLRRSVNSADAGNSVVDEFVAGLWDLAGIRR